jgi:hypothetical protein
MRSTARNGIDKCPAAYAAQMITTGVQRLSRWVSARIKDSCEVGRAVSYPVAHRPAGRRWVAFVLLPALAACYGASLLQVPPDSVGGSIYLDEFGEGFSDRRSYWGGR